MNKEVEELLHLMKSYASDNGAQGYLTNSQVKLLLDNINQLEEENKQLKDNIDEAIEYLKKYKEDMFKKTNSHKTYLRYITPCIEALEILERGKNNECNSNNRLR